MKSCPKCSRTYANSLSFCVEDGTTLSAPFDSNPTLVIPITESAPSLTRDETHRQATVIRQSSSPRFLYAVILILLVLITAIAVALFYERSKPASSPINVKATEASAPATRTDKDTNSIPKQSTSQNTPQQTSSNISAALTTQDLNGEWEIVDTIETSSSIEYINVKVGFRLFIKQLGQEITGEGERTWISTRQLEQHEHTPIHITGVIKGGTVEATFVEEGSRRKSSGRFVWRIEEGNRMTGTFVSTAANTSGKSVVTKK
jgi:hypothetical protein